MTNRQSSQLIHPLVEQYVRVRARLHPPSAQFSNSLVIEFYPVAVHTRSRVAVATPNVPLVRVHADESVAAAVKLKTRGLGREGDQVFHLGWSVFDMLRRASQTNTN